MEEITELNIENENPSLIPQFQLYTFCKWGALIVTLLATFTSLINRSKLLIFRHPILKSLASSSSFKHLQQILDDDFDYSDDDSSSSSSEPELDDEDFESNSSIEQEDEDFRIAGSRNSLIGGNRFSWSDFAAGKSVVQLWDGFGLGLDFDDDSFDGEDSIWGRNKKVSSYFGNQNTTSSAEVVFLADSSKNDAVVLSGYDKRIGSRTPAIYADWKKRGGRVVNVKPGGVDKIYVKDGDTGGITVGDIRNVKTPLENLTESDNDDDDSWWDADGVNF